MGHPPSVLLDATSLPPSWGGVARYIQGLLTGLGEQGVAVDVVAKSGDIERLRAAAPAHRYHPAPAAIRSRPLRFAWEQLGLPRLAARLGVASIHSPHYTFPLFARRGSVVTLHDATFFSDPSAHSRLKRTFFRWWIRRASRRADAVVTPSRATASAVAASTRVDAVTVVAHLGVDTERFRPPSAEETTAFAAAHELGDAGWIAFLGTIEPRKNVPALLAAYAESRARLLAAGRAAPALVLSGSRGWDEEAARLLDGLGPGDGVLEAGYLPLDELHVLLGGAVVTVYPSLGEGFGLPVLEAMACGGAVLTTPRLSIPEVGGDAVAYSEPDAPALARALDTLLDDHARRDALRSAAEERAAGFTWARCAAAHLDAYAAATGARR